MYYTPYNRDYMEAVKQIPTTRYDMEDTAWCCSAKFDTELISTVKRFFPDIPVDIQEHCKANGFDKMELPQHLLELEIAAQKQVRADVGGGWTIKTIEAFILKWSRKYNGEYAMEDVELALRTYIIDPIWLEAVEKKIDFEQFQKNIVTHFNNFSLFKMNIERS